MVGPEQIASKRCEIEIHAFSHALENNYTVTFLFQRVSN